MSDAPHVHGASAGEAALVVYGVHGRGQSPEYIRALAERVGGLEHIRWVMPGAPGDSWYPQGFMARIEDNQPHVGAALHTVRTHLHELLSGQTPVVALGFSQGACLLAEHLLTDQPQVAGIVLHTGGYLGPGHRTFASAPGYSGIPVAVLTAREDDWVPLHRCEETARALESIGARVELTVYDDIEHHINDDAIRRIRGLLEQVADVGTGSADG